MRQKTVAETPNNQQIYGKETLTMLEVLQKSYINCLLAQGGPFELLQNYFSVIGLCKYCPPGICDFIEGLELPSAKLETS